MMGHFKAWVQQLVRYVVVEDALYSSRGEYWEYSTSDCGVLYLPIIPSNFRERLSGCVNLTA